MAGFSEYGQYDGLGLAKLIATKAVSAGEVLDACRERLGRINPLVNAVVATMEETSSPDVGEGAETAKPFRGVPFLLKDLGASMKGTVTTFGSKLFSDVRADHDSEVVARYKRAGCSAQPAIPGTSLGPPEARAAGPPPQSPPASFPGRMRPMVAVPSEFRLPAAGCSG